MSLLWKTYFQHRFSPRGLLAFTCPHTIFFSIIKLLLHRPGTSAFPEKSNVLGTYDCKYCPWIIMGGYFYFWFGRSKWWISSNEPDILLLGGSICKSSRYLSPQFGKWSLSGCQLEGVSCTVAWICKHTRLVSCNIFRWCRLLWIRS